MVLIIAAVAAATGTATTKITMLGGSHRLAGAFGTGIVGTPIAGLANAADFVMKAMGASATSIFIRSRTSRLRYHRFAFFVDRCEISRDRQHKKWPVRDTRFTAQFNHGLYIDP
jgi:hypothetical protein